MKAFELSFASVLLRFYLMMGIIIGSLFMGQPLLAFLALPVFLSAILGVEINWPNLLNVNFNIKPTKRSRKDHLRMATS